MEIAKITSHEEWKYFAKGGANILFKYVGSHDYLKHKLLRLRLHKPDEEYISTCELYDFIELKCKAIFSKLIIDVQLVVLDSKFVKNLNSNGNSIMLKEKYGLLLPNMLEGMNGENFCLSKHSKLYMNETYDSIMFELKPKWLYENYDTNYCRSCLLAQYKNYPRHFCPLDFLHEDTIEAGINDLFSLIPKNTLDKFALNKMPIKQLFIKYLLDPNNVFQKLKKYQQIEKVQDSISNLKSKNDVSPELSLIMTLRDTGLFIKFERYSLKNHSHNLYNNVPNIYSIDNYGKFLVTCKMYDLDLKSNNKFSHWVETEAKILSIYNSDNPNWRHCHRTRH